MMNYKDILGITFNPLLNFIFPRICLGCGGKAEYLCSECSNSFKKPRYKCFACGRKNPFGIYCVACHKEKHPEGVLARFAYEGRLKEIIHQYKYEDAFILSHDLVKSLVPLVEGVDNYKSYSLGYIPLSPVKMRSRGYNQAELLAREVGEALGLPVLDLMERLHRKETQVTSKTKKARKQNVKGVFKARVGIEIPKKLILVDDVVTTGATVEEATKILKRAGVKKVVVIALAMGA